MSSIQDMLGQARQRGWSFLPESLGFTLLAELGVATPGFVEFDRPEGLTAEVLARLRGDRVVLRVDCPDLPHKSDLGGIRILPRKLEAVTAAARKLRSRLSAYPLRGFLLQEWIEHEPGIGGELLVSLRWDREFGPVLTCGPGGVHAEVLARELRAGRGMVSISLAELPSFETHTLAGSVAVELMTSARRGRSAPLTPQGLFEALKALVLRAEPLLTAGIEEIEINPLVVHRDRLVALDVSVRVAPGRPSPPPARPLEKIRCLLEPRSIAIVGVSRRRNPGRVILQNVLRQGFEPSRIFVVRRGETRIEGCLCVPSIDQLPERVDLLIVAVAADQVADLLDEVIAARAAESLIVIPGGLDERADSGSQVERLRRSLARVRRTEWKGPLVNGANCMGLRSSPGRYDTFFLPDYKTPPAGRSDSTAALIAQSGAFLAARSSKLDGIAFKYSISIGNQLDLTFGDYLAYLTQDEDLRLIALYVEGFKPLDGRRFLRAARILRQQDRRVILYRAGRSPEGVQAAASHTASVAGSYATTVDLARAAGVLVADSMTDFEDLIELDVRLSDRPFRGSRLAGLSNAGFECVALSDRLGSFSAAELGDETATRLRKLLADAGVAELVDVRNPLDVTPMLGDELYIRVAESLLADANVDVGIVGCVPLTGALSTLPASAHHDEDLDSDDSIATRLGDLWRRTDKPWVAVIDGGAPYDALARKLRGAGIPTFRTMDRALEILNAYARWADPPARIETSALGQG